MVDLDVMLEFDDREDVFIVSAITVGLVLFYIIMIILFSKKPIYERSIREIVKRLPKYSHCAEIDIQELAKKIDSDRDVVARFLKQLARKYKIGEIKKQKRGDFSEDELYFLVNERFTEEITTI